MVRRARVSTRVTTTHSRGHVAQAKLGVQALVIALVLGLAAVPAAFAGNGHGGGKPSWAGGGGKPSWAGGGKPSWAGSGHADAKAHHGKKPKKDKAKHHEAESTEDSGTQSLDGTDLEGLNPAWYCKTLSDEMTQLAQDFADMFGTNPNDANAFGMCVSRRAHGEDLAGVAGGDDSQDDSSCETTEPPTDEGADEGAVEEENAEETTTSDDDVVANTPDDQGSDEEVADPEQCESDDSATDGPADDEQVAGDDEQGEEDQGQDESEASDEDDSSALETALRFLRL
jgi:hypothetical protein